MEPGYVLLQAVIPGPSKAWIILFVFEAERHKRRRVPMLERPSSRCTREGVHSSRRKNGYTGTLDRKSSIH
jgi:hypothetical protein